MLSPAEWGGSAPHPFEGSYRLEADSSWTPVEEAESVDEMRQALRGLLSAPSDPESDEGAG